MTADDNTGWSAFSSVFGNEAHHLLCKWHVHRSWRRKLHSLLPKEREFQNEIYQAMVVLLEERDSTKFKAMSLAFVSTYVAVSEEFVRYFQEFYLNRPEKWAMCYRNFPHANTDTNMFVESFHNRLKTYYMKRKRGRRLDDLVNLLLTIEEDDFWRHRLDMMYGKDERAKTTTNRHKSGLKIEDDDVLKVAPSVWEVRSQRKSGVRSEARNENTMSCLDDDESDGEYNIKPEMAGKSDAQDDQDGDRELRNDPELSFPVHRVELKRDQCRDDFCFTRCLELSCLGLCGHLYQCSCLDVSLMCKHIHKVHSVRLRNNEARRIHQFNDNDVDCTQDALAVYNTEVHEIKREERSEEKLKERAIAALNCIESYLENANVRSYGIGRVCVVLEQLALECSSIAKVENVSQGHFDTPVTVPPNEKLKIQFRPKKMVRTSKKRSASASLSGPSPKKSKTIKTMLLGGTHFVVKKEENNESCHPQKSEKTPFSSTEAKAKTNLCSNELSDQQDKFPTSRKDPKQEKAAKAPSTTISLQGKEKLQTTKKGKTFNVVPNKVDYKKLQTTKKGKSYKAASKQVNQVAITESTTCKSLTKTILKNGPNNLSLLVLKSLDTELSAFEVKKLVDADRNFRPRWLYDEIIDSFCWMIAKEVPGVLLCPTLVTAALARRRQNALRLDHLWRVDSMDDARAILAPWNPSGSHWILIAIFLPSLKAVYLDPLSNSRNATDRRVVQAKAMFSHLIRVKKSDDAKLQWSFPNHALQEDSYNCGVFTCIYAERIAKNQSINSEIDPLRERQRIYAKITGSCLRPAQNGKSHINKGKCIECQGDGGVEWVECSRCKQWHHCNCVGLSLQEADNLPEFYCPS